jgi:hypothetical protein
MFLLLTIIFALLCVCLFLFFKKAPKRRVVPDAVEAMVKETMEIVDNAIDDVGGEAFFDPTTKKSSFRAKLIMMAKTEFGHLKRTEANRLMVRKFMRDQMRERGLRPSHIVAHLDISVACFFVASQQEIAAHQVGATFEAQRREGDVTSFWESALLEISKMLGFRNT